MAHVLVTGSAGYVGSHVLALLKRAGHHPVVFDNLTRGFAELVQPHAVPFVRGNLADRALLRPVLHDYQIDAILHFAALAYVGESTEVPDRYYRSNTANGLTLLEEAIAYRPETPPALVFSSTCAAYGTPTQLPIRETTARCPISPYGRCKLSMEWMVADLSHQHHFGAVILRYFNAAGADPPIPSAIQAAEAGSPFFIHGDDFDTPDGTAIRDLVHVRDLAAAPIDALDDLIAGGETTDLNFGTGVGHAVRQVVHCIERMRRGAVGVR